MSYWFSHCFKGLSSADSVWAGSGLLSSSRASKITLLPLGTPREVGTRRSQSSSRDLRFHGKSGSIPSPVIHKLMATIREVPESFSVDVTNQVQRELLAKMRSFVEIRQRAPCSKGNATASNTGSERSVGAPSALFFHFQSRLEYSTSWFTSLSWSKACVRIWKFENKAW